MPKMKPYAVALDGLHVLMVAAASKKVAAELIGTTTYMMTTWEGGMNDDDEAVALAEPGVVFRKRVTGAGEWEKVPSDSAAPSEKSPEMAKKLTTKQIQRFEKICKDMADLIDELHRGGLPDAVVFLEDGNPALYASWPSSMDRHPLVPDANGVYWHKAGGGAY